MNNAATLLRCALVGMLTLTSVGCASIVHSGNRPVMIDSNPQGATVTITDRKDRVVFSDVTPVKAKLDPRGGYFCGQHYTVTFELDGYASAHAYIEPEITPFYVGNIVFGGLIGFVVVDPLTGCMWNLRPLSITKELKKLPEPAAAPSTNAPPPVSAPITTPEVVTPAVKAPSASDTNTPPAPVTPPTEVPPPVSDNTNSPAPTPPPASDATNAPAAAPAPTTP